MEPAQIMKNVMILYSIALFQFNYNAKMITKLEKGHLKFVDSE